MIGKEKYEARYLLSVISAVINQTELPRTVRTLDWGHIFKLADYHDVANVVYYGVLGAETDITDKWKNKFYERYQEVLLGQDRFRSLEGILKNQLETNEIHALFLKDTILSQCYELHEIRATSSTNILVELEKYHQVNRLMKKLDFWPVENRRNRGHSFYRIPRTTVTYFTDFGFHTKAMKKYFDFSIKGIEKSQGYKYIHEFVEEEFFVYYMCQLVYNYACGEIAVCDIMDLWVFYKKYRQVLDFIYIKKELKKLEIQDFAHRLLYLSYLWFGEINEEEQEKKNLGMELLTGKNDSDEGVKTGKSHHIYTEAQIYDSMEEYILTKGKEGRVVSGHLLPLIKEVLDFYVRDRRKEWFRKKKDFVFPDRLYMETLFPKLKEKKNALVYYWTLRLGKFAKQLLKQKCRHIFEPLLKKIVRSKEKMSKQQYYEKNTDIQSVDDQNSRGYGPAPKLQKKDTQIIDNEIQPEEDTEVLKIDKELQNQCPGIALGVISYETSVHECTPELLEMIDSVVVKAKANYVTNEVSSLPHIFETRKAYQMLGKSPHEYRNYAEALIRAILDEQSLVHENNIQGINHLLSVSSGYAISSYNKDRISGSIIYQQAEEGTSYKVGNEGKALVDIGNLPGLTDEKGFFGTPCFDNGRVQLEFGKCNIMTVIYSFDGLNEMKQWVEEYKYMLSICCDVKEVEVQYIGE